MKQKTILNTLAYMVLFVFALTTTTFGVNAQSLTNELSVNLTIADYYPQETNYIFICNTTGFIPNNYDWDFGDGEYLYDLPTSDVYHTYILPGTYLVLCIPDNNPGMLVGTLTVNVTTEVNTEVCGNGVINIELNEECDDGGNTSDDGCSSLCIIEAGWNCTGEPSICTTGLVPINGDCGPAAKNYASSATEFTDLLCDAGTINPENPNFPARGSSTTWECIGINEGSTETCIATRSRSSGGSSNGGSSNSGNTNTESTSPIGFNVQCSEWSSCNEYGTHTRICKQSNNRDIMIEDSCTPEKTKIESQIEDSKIIVPQKTNPVSRLQIVEQVPETIDENNNERTSNTGNLLTGQVTGPTETPSGWTRFISWLSRIFERD